ncbi:Pentatricopeptide repeat [Dillenia turbinata]|uniref:Pentatricopeptide repeat n=1 Tax=Dillenia turbinata TaxID=194707 RepID=A0AAN8YXS9_9MAGN
MVGKTLRLANLLQTFIDKGALLSGKLLHAYFLRNGLSADKFLFNRLIELYSKCGKINWAFSVFDKMARKDVYTWNAMLGACCKAGSLVDAYQLFENMPERNVVSWNTLISAFVRNEYEEKALICYFKMRREGFVPTHFTLASVFSGCGALDDAECGRVCHSLAIKIGLDKNMYVGNALLAMYSKCRRVDDAVQAFRDVPVPNEVSFTAMLSGLAETDRVYEALDLFRLMHTSGVCIDSVLLSSVTSVCGVGRSRESGFTSQGGELLLDVYGRQVHGYGVRFQSEKAIECLQRMQHSGFEPDEVTYINMLAACIKSDNIEMARQIFDRMFNPSLSSWNAIFSGYSQNGDHKEAIKLFRQMQFQNVKPDRTTFAIILSSCATMGLLQSGKQLHAASQKAGLHMDNYVASGLISIYSRGKKLDTAKQILDRLPELDVVCYNAMIAGLSLGSLDEEAFTLFKHMRVKGVMPTQFSFTTILNSCAKLSSLSQGRQLHAQILKDGHVNDTFVGSALIDMYCKCGNMDAARQFFDAMPLRNTVIWNEMIHGYAQSGHGDEAEVMKNPGYSWIEHENKTQSIKVDHNFHEMNDEVGADNKGIPCYVQLLHLHHLKQVTDVGMRGEHQIWPACTQQVPSASASTTLPELLLLLLLDLVQQVDADTV